MGEKRVVDLSRFFLFEAAGDSEADLDANMVSFSKVEDQDNAYKGNGDDDDDDAESCSYDVGYNCTLSYPRDAMENHGHKYDAHEDEEGNSIHEIDDYDDHHNNHNHHDHNHDGYEEEYEMREEEMVSEVESTANTYSSIRKSCKRKMSEIEKNRLFWEACLAS